ncbi:Zn-dependent hydrolase [Paracoccus contaminans]|uniref:Zn-dependent hydrolase n=1 Tax=Paracoccus contaminans TaxID=1945662 RepID=A0A1W6CTZ8_9RHOB|nr:Zn-dependent hydrolase [Paracoccus contaminans]ARJ68321.1 Zn-dependent hydrolase [Paracoccus contaminans]
MTASPDHNHLVSAEAIGVDIAALAALTEPDRPWTRRSFTPMFDRGRDWLRAAFAGAGLTTGIDAAGNLIGRRAGSGAGCGTILLGSHTDTVPDGGRFDGVAGVAAALEVVRALDRAGVVLRHDLAVVDFLAEEVSGFGVSCIGSRAMAGIMPADWLERRWQDRSLAEAIAAVGGMPEALGRPLSAPLAGPLRAFLELHIEQGTILESEGTAIGLVRAIAGITRIEIIVEGRPDHAGTTPMDGRNDALVSAAPLVEAVRHEAARPREGRHFTGTVGEFEVFPNAANVIPGRVRLLIDARAERRSDMEAFIAWAKALAAGVPGASARVISDNPPVPMDADLLAVLAEAADAAGVSHRPLTSGAGHDAAHVARLGPAAMVFVPSRGGRSHCPEEWTEIDQIADGAEAIARAVIELDRR